MINPYTHMFDEITTSALIKIDAYSVKVDNSEAPVNEAGFVIHSPIHMGRQDARAVLHLPSPWTRRLGHG
ncbi:MAG: class II aldolase/adducin family protein [Rhizomicrobium sp.]